MRFEFSKKMMPVGHSSNVSSKNGKTYYNVVLTDGVETATFGIDSDAYSALNLFKWYNVGVVVSVTDKYGTFARISDFVPVDVDA